jgi:hypothetical protein
VTSASDRGDAKPEAEVWDRTSGDEEEGQDAEAQAAETAHRAAELFEVKGVEWDEDVPGDTPWDERAGMMLALGRSRARGRVFVTRNPSRLWRGRPGAGLALAESIPDLEVLGKAHWSRRAGVWVHDEDGDEVLRFVDAWQAWTTKRGIREETQVAMTAIKEGRRATRSGKPHHRPPKELLPDALEAARRAYFVEGATEREARDAYREAAGFNLVTDERARKRRDVSRTVLIGRLKALGPPAGLVGSVGKAGRSERGVAPAAASPVGQGSLSDKA